MARATDFKIFPLEDIGPHYARTLRLWEYYLCDCEGGFIERQLGTVQVLLTKPRCRRAPLA